MGDEPLVPGGYLDLQLDQLNLPRATQSGLLDTATVSSMENRIEISQTAALTTNLNNYYTGESTLSELRENLLTIGYEANRVDSISQSAHVEFLFRAGHEGQDSGLSLNQAQYVNDNFDNEHIRNMLLITNSQGVPTGYRSDIRSDDGERTVLPLPAQIPFDVLTRTQREDVNENRELVNILNDHLQPDPTITDNYYGVKHDIRDDEINEISQFSTQYLNEQITIAQLANSITSIYGITNVNNIHEILGEYLIDIQKEKDFRENNDGIPQELTEMTYNYIRENDNSQGQRYNNQPVFVIPNTNTYYYFGTYGQRIVIPVLNEDGTLAQDQDVLDDTTRRGIQGILSNYNQPDGETNIEDETGLRPRSAPDLSLQQKNTINVQTTLLMNGDITLDNYLSSIDSFGLNDYQTRRLIEYASTKQDFGQNAQTIMNNYLDNPIYPINSPSGQTFYVSNEAAYRTFLESMGMNQEDQDLNVAGINQEFERQHENNVAQRFHTQTEVRPSGGLSESNLQNLRNQNSEGYQQPFPVITPSAIGLGDARDRENIGLPPIDPLNRFTPSLEEIDEILPPIPSSIPVVAGGTQPIDPVTGRDFEVGLTEEAFRRYENYYNENQYLYSNFRLEFAHLLTKNIVQFASASAGFGIYKILRHKFVLYTQLEKDRTSLYTHLVNKLQSREQRLDRKLTQDAQELQETAQKAVAREQEQETLSNMISDFRLKAREYVRDNFPSINTIKNDLLAEKRQLQSRGLVATDPQFLALEERIFDVQHRLQLEEIKYLDTNQPDFRQIEERRAMIRTSKGNLIAKLRNGFNERRAERGKVGFLTRLNQQVYSEKIINLLNDVYNTLEDIDQNFPGIMGGLVVGDFLGASLAGYLFPTYDDPEFEEYIEKKVNQNLTPIQDKDLDLDLKEFDKILINENKLKAFEKTDKVPILTGALNPFNNKPIYQDMDFVPVKANQSTGRMPTYKEIQDLKSTLNKEELNRLKNKRLLFDENNNLKPKNNDKCMNIIKENQIKLISIR
mgnify:CR=1 FL=1